MNILSFRARIKGTKKGKRKEGFALPLLFNVQKPLSLIVDRLSYTANAEDQAAFAASCLQAKTMASALRGAYRADKPFQVAIQVTEAEERQETGYVARTESLYAFHTEVL